MNKAHHPIPLAVALIAALTVALTVAVACAPISAPTPTPSGVAQSGEIQDVVWQWFSLKNQTTGTTDAIPGPASYTVVFRSEGTLDGQADCNVFAGTYTEGSDFGIDLEPAAVDECGEGSLSREYLELLEAIVAGGPDGTGGLALETAGGELRMEFHDGGQAEP